MSTRESGPDLSGQTAGLYLRKSRMEEGLDTEEVLSKHQKALLDYARSRNIHILETYPEVVSGESLYARPQMLLLLQAVEEGRYDCVLCMDLDRLSRGRMKDQGIILDAFRDSATLIVTPEKTYDLSDDLDDELAEMKTFISRREYKIINKRLRRGLRQAIEDGCYVANAPYGYRKTVVDRKPTLEIDEAEAGFVRMMFQLYAQGHGCISVARHINLLGAKPHRAQEFSRSSVAKILQNPTYVGKIVWNQKKHMRKNSNGTLRHTTVQQPRDQWIITDGLHPPIVDPALFDRVQTILSGRYVPPRRDGTVKSALAGLVRCANCGQAMQRMSRNGGAYLLCTKPGCCASTQFDLVEERVLNYLEEALARLPLPPSVPPDTLDTQTLDTAQTAVRKELAAARRQKKRLHELLELGEYDLPTFRERMEAVQEKIFALEQKQLETGRAMEQTKAAPPAPLPDKLGTVLDFYGISDAADRNALLKSVIQVVWYRKEKKARPADFYLDVRLRPF